MSTEDVILDEFKSSEDIKKSNYHLITKAMLSKNLLVFNIYKDYQNVCVLLNKKSDLLEVFLDFKTEHSIYVVFDTHIGRTISTNLQFIPGLFLKIILSFSNSFIVYQKFRSKSNRVVFDYILACNVEIWLKDDTYYTTENPTNNPPFKIGSKDWIMKHKIAIDDKELKPIPNNNKFPIDIVYTWVNDKDPEWQKELKKAIKDYKEKVFPLKASKSHSRFTNRDELKYSLRSICMYADFFRKVFIVTSGQIPEWLDVNNSKIDLIFHKDIFPSNKYIPTFNSHAIETRLHHIKGLSEHFICFNDDMFIGRPISSKLFFENETINYIFPSTSTYIGLNDKNFMDLPSDAAAKNNRDLIFNKFNRLINQKFLHVPYPLRKSILFEIEDAFKSELLQTAGNKFRNISDTPLVNSLYQHYSYHKGFSIIDKAFHEYLNIETKNFKYRLDALLSKSESQRPDTFCINEINKKVQAEEDNILIKNFLENYFPFNCEFEKKQN